MNASYILLARTTETLNLTPRQVGLTTDSKTRQKKSSLPSPSISVCLSLHQSGWLSVRPLSASPPGRRRPRRLPPSFGPSSPPDGVESSIEISSPIVLSVCG
eukprot:GHVU01154193.1.p3 GENE.GHVU01154193.1~~GHVU01154193.1.p3  ORF type:complete len:102 (+),score=4.06 GHVU01154193.1:280-585(+)